MEGTMSKQHFRSKKNFKDEKSKQENKSEQERENTSIEHKINSNDKLKDIQVIDIENPKYNPDNEQLKSKHELKEDKELKGLEFNEKGKCKVEKVLDTKSSDKMRQETKFNEKSSSMSTPVRNSEKAGFSQTIPYDEQLDIKCITTTSATEVQDGEPPSYNEIYNTDIHSLSCNIGTEPDLQRDSGITSNDLDQQESCEIHDPWSWSDVLYEFTQTTSLHGARQITEPQPFFVRRLLWLIVFIGSGGVLLLQLVLSVRYYMTSPVSVDVRINYNNSITFPTVTLCNVNAFRMTVAYEKSYYDLINELYKRSNPIVNLTKYHASNFTVETLFNGTTHGIEDMIVSCKWEGVPCNLKDDFKPQITDFGMCYTYNGGGKESDLKKAFVTGSAGGLSLNLNIEQYEYMRGPNEGAGLKILVHNYNEVPQVKDHGVAVPPGSHAFMAIKTIQVNNLRGESDVGTCSDSLKLEFFPEYTLENCHSNCKQLSIMRKCHCKDVYMPGDLDVCTLEEYQGCLLDVVEEFAEHKSLCDCPVPCNRRMYEPIISYAAISNFDIQALLRKKNTEQIKEKYIKAREVNQKVNKGIAKEDKYMINQFADNMQQLNLVMKQVSSNLATLYNQLTESHNVIQQRINFHLRKGLEGINFVLEERYIRIWKSYYERIFNDICVDFMGVPEFLKGIIDDANGTVPFDNRNDRMILYIAVQSFLVNRIHINKVTTFYVRMAEERYRRRYSYMGKQVTYKGHYDNDLVSIILFDAGINHIGNESYVKQFDFFLEQIDNMDIGLKMLLDVGKGFVEEAHFNDTLYETGKDLYISSCTTFKTAIYEYEKLIVDLPRGIIADVVRNFRLDNLSQSEMYFILIKKVNLTQQSLRVSLSELWKHGQQAADQSLLYLSGSNVTKKEIAMLVTSQQIEETFHQVHLFFNDLRFYISDLQNELQGLNMAYSKVWAAMLGDPHTKLFYKAIHRDINLYLNESTTYSYTDIFENLLEDWYSEEEFNDLSKDEMITAINGDFHVMDIEDVLRNMSLEFNQLQNLLTHTYTLTETKEQLITSYEKYKTTLEKFLQGNKIDSEFFRQNFMRLDIFMQELRYEEISQHPAYDVIQLLSDIGGSMGLFIGASVLSIVEFIDVILHHGAKHLFKKKSKK